MIDFLHPDLRLIELELLKEQDADLVVDLLDISSQELIDAFPAKVEAYLNDAKEDFEGIQESDDDII